MTTEYITPTARYATLRDYLRVLRRYRLLIALLGIVGAVAGFIYTASQATTYTSTAQVSFQDPTQALPIVGLPANSVQSPGQVASVAAELITNPSIMSEVKTQLGTRTSVGALTGAVSGTVIVPSDLLQVTAKSSDPNFAQRLANTTAHVLVAQDNAQARAQFARLAATIQGRIARLTAGGKPGGTPATTNELVFYEDELGRLQTLASFATTATFAQPAKTTASVSSKARGVLIGLAFGLLLAILVAFLRDSMDRRLRVGQDYRSVKLPVLGHVRNRALGRIAQLSGDGRQDQSLDVEAFRILRRNLELLSPENPPKAIVVTSALAEEGKSSVASSLAGAMASAGRRTLLVEADLRRPSLAERFGVEQLPGLADYLAGTVAPHDTLRTIQLAQPDAGDGTSPWSADRPVGGAIQRLVFIPSGSQTSRSAELLGSDDFKQFVEQVTQTYDVVVFDSSPLLPVSDTLEVLPWVDAAVLCVREGHTTLDQVSAAKDVLSRFPRCLAGIVVTGIKPRGGADDAVYAHAYQSS